MGQSSRPIRTVLVVDPHCMAHVPFIHAATLACLTSLGVRCISLSLQRESIRAEFHGLIQRNELSGAQAELVQWGDLPATAGDSWVDLQRVLEPWMEAQADSAATLVWVGWLDYLMGTSRKTPRFPLWPWFWAGAFYLLPPSFQAGPRGSISWFKERLMPFWRRCADQRCCGLAVLDEYWLADARRSLLNRCFRPASRALLKFPDVASTHRHALEPVLQRRAGRIRIGLLGQLSWRKGVLPFLEAACRAESANPQLEFLMAGELRTDQFGDDDRDRVLSILRNPPANLHYIREPIPDEAQFNALVSQCDLIHVAYHHFPGSSNLLTKAAAFRVPVLANPGYLIGRRVQDYALGWVAAAEDLGSYLDVVLDLNNEQLDHARGLAHWDDFCSLNDFNALENMFSSLLASRV